MILDVSVSECIIRGSIAKVCVYHGAPRVSINRKELIDKKKKGFVLPLDSWLMEIDRPAIAEGARVAR